MPETGFRYNFAFAHNDAEAEALSEMAAQGQAAELRIGHIITHGTGGWVYNSES